MFEIAKINITENIQNKQLLYPSRQADVPQVVQYQQFVLISISAKYQEVQLFLHLYKQYIDDTFVHRIRNTKDELIEKLNKHHEKI